MHFVLCIHVRRETSEDICQQELGNAYFLKYSLFPNKHFKPRLDLQTIHNCRMKQSLPEISLEGMMGWLKENLLLVLTFSGAKIKINNINLHHTRSGGGFRSWNRAPASQPRRLHHRPARLPRRALHAPPQAHDPASNHR